MLGFFNAHTSNKVSTRLGNCEPLAQCCECAIRMSSEYGCTPVGYSLIPFHSVSEPCKPKLHAIATSCPSLTRRSDNCAVCTPYPVPTKGALLAIRHRCGVTPARTCFAR